MNTSASVRYTPVAISLHWLLALLMFGMVALGFYMSDLHLSPLKLRLINWHKWTGVTIFLLALLRLAWRVTHVPPSLPQVMTPLLRAAAAGAHLALYALMFVIPLSGWLMSSAQGFRTVWFGVLPLPNLLHKDPALGERLAQLHLTLNIVMLVLVAGHVVAALKHHLADRDDVLLRMLPRRRGSWSPLPK
jgi:cytochrome b561